jgi:hypothetical protein
MNPPELMEKYHFLWEVEQPFRKAKTRGRADFQSHPRFERGALDYLFAALAISRNLQAEMSIRKIVRTPPSIHSRLMPRASLIPSKPRISGRIGTLVQLG